MKKVTSLGIRTRLTALLLAICMSIAVLPGSVIALENDSTNYSNNVNETANEAVNETLNEAENSAENLLEPIIVEEVISLRTQYSKTFLCDDGSYISAEYSQSVHYEDENGNWLEYTEDVLVNDNTKLIVGDNLKTQERNNNDEKYIELYAGDYMVSWTPKTSKINDSKIFNTSKPNVFQSSKETISVVNSPVKEKQLIKKEYLSKQATAYYVSNDKLSITSDLSYSDYLSKDYIDRTNKTIKEYNNSVIQNVRYNNTVVKYENALGEGIDVKYTISSYSVKEDVIVEKRGIFDSYSISIDSGNLTPQLNEDGSIEFYDINCSVHMCIAAPLMYDSKNSISTDIRVEIERKEDEYLITYIPSQEWLSSIDREYPVVIDPEYSGGQYSYNSSSMQQTFVCSNYPENTYNNYRFMYVGNQGSSNRNYGIGEGWFRFVGMPDFSGKTITSSYIDFTIDSESDDNICIDAFIPNSSFDRNITWESKPEVDYCVASNIMPTYSNSKYHYYIPLRTLPTQWEHVNARAFGIYIKISSISTGFSLILSSNSPVNPPVFVYSYEIVNSTSNMVEKNLPSGFYTIESVGYEDIYLSVNSTTNDVIASNEITGLSEKWYVLNHGDNTYSFTPLASQNCRMEVHCADYSDHRPMTIYDYTSSNNLNSNAIRFKIIEDSSGIYSIRPISNTNYALTLYNSDQCYMYFYNRYTDQYRAFEKLPYDSCQLNKYNGKYGQMWTLNPTTYDYAIGNKPTVIYSGTTNYIMTTTDYQDIAAVSNEYYTGDSTWVSENTNVATITSSGSTARIMPKGDGTTRITLKNGFGIPCDSFVLTVYDPAEHSDNTTIQTLCDLRGYRLDVPLLPQSEDYLCGSACVAMILKYKNYQKDGAYLTDKQVYSEANKGGQGTFVYALTYVLNGYLGGIYSNAGGCTDIHEIIKNSIIADKPVIAQLKLFNSNNQFGYSSTGHYVLVTEIYMDSSEQYQVVINDPFSANWYSTKDGQIISSMSTLTLEMHINDLLGYLIY